MTDICYRAVVPCRHPAKEFDNLYRTLRTIAEAFLTVRRGNARRRGTHNREPGEEPAREAPKNPGETKRRAECPNRNEIGRFQHRGEASGASELIPLRPVKGDNRRELSLVSASARRCPKHPARDRVTVLFFVKAVAFEYHAQ